MTPRAWHVIPAVGLAATLAALALALAITPAAATAAIPGALAAGALAAALTAAIRASAGDEPAVLAGAIAGALVGTAATCAAALAAGADPIRASLAGAAAAWTLAELVRPAPATARPAVAVLPAAIAAALDPSYVALVLIAGIRLWRAPQRRGRWPIAVPAAGALAILVAILALRADAGALATLGHAWTGVARAAATTSVVARLSAGAGNILGPLAAVAALAGLALATTRTSSHALALLALVAGALVTSARAGAVAPAALALAGLAIGVAIARLAALVHHPAGQACLGATAGFLLLVTPAWTLSLAIR